MLLDIHLSGNDEISNSYSRYNRARNVQHSSQDRLSLINDLYPVRKKNLEISNPIFYCRLNNVTCS